MVYRHQGEPDEGDLFEGRRTCRRCKERKAIGEFHWAISAKKTRYRRRTCKACDHSRARGVRAANPQKYAQAARARTFRRKYGITLGDFDALLVDQGYRCRICWDRLFVDTTHVDHDHKTGAVRGLLCTNCNLGLGHFRDDPWRLSNALTYLRVAAGEQEDREDVA